MKKDVEKKIYRVKVFTKEKTYNGIQLDSHDSKTILLKLDNGYNIGIKKSDVKKIENIKEIKDKKNADKINQDKKLDGVAVIITGGTIASKVDYTTGAVKPTTKISDLIHNTPELSKIARINSIEVPFLVQSEDITSSHWKKLAKKTAELLNKQNNKGVIILHGTDTTHHTAAALSFMLKNLGKPVVLTYSQRSIDRGSSDAFLNLKCAFHAALSKIGEVIVVGHASTEDNYCYALRGTKVRKMHSSRRDAFKPINIDPLARIYPDGKIEYIEEYRKRDEQKKAKALADFEDKVALVKFSPNSSSDILYHFLKSKYKGIVIEGTGFGNISVESKDSWTQAVKKLSEKMIVCMTTQTIFGRTNPKVYSNGRKIEKAGALFLKDMLSETAYVKLGCMLAREKSIEKVKKLMLQDFAHEFNDRITN